MKPWALLILLSIIVIVVCSVKFAERYDEQVDLSLWEDAQDDNYWMIPPSYPIIDWYDVNNVGLKDPAEAVYIQGDQWILPGATKFRKSIRGVPCQSDMDCSPPFSYCSTYGKCKYIHS